MSDFALNWRFTDPKYEVLPPMHLEQIQPLDKESAELIWKLITDTDLHFQEPFKPGFFRHQESIKIAEDHESPEECSRVRKWLYQCAVPFAQDVYLSWEPSWAIKTNWKILIKYWNAFYYPISDDLTVIDDSLDWCLLFHHEHELHFGTNSPRTSGGPA